MLKMRHAVAADLGRCVRTLVEAYSDDPFLRWMFPDPTTRPTALTEWFRVAITDAHYPNGHYYRSEDFDVVAIWIPPDVPLATPAQYERNRDLVASYSSEEHANAVFEGVGRRNLAKPEGPTWQIIYTAVTPSRQGNGLGSQALAKMLEMCDEQGFSVYTNSTNPRNLTFCARLGFERLGDIELAEGVIFHPMLRRPRAD